MDPAHRLNEAEIADALSGTPPEKRIADCDTCAKEFAAWKDLGDGLRRELDERADLPAYFWTRQQARIRERLVPRAASLRWAAAAILALVLLAFGLVRHNVPPRMEIAQNSPSTATVQNAQTDPDDALLQDIDASLQQEVPAPLMPAAVLVQELDLASKQAQQVKEN